MNALYKLWQKLTGNKEYREAFVEAQAKRLIPLQIRALLKQRGWSQAKLAQEAKLTQGAISRAQDPDYGNLTVNTLVRIAAGFDVAFVGRFVPFSELGRWYTDITEESMMVPSFGDDLGCIERKHPSQETVSRVTIEGQSFEMSSSQMGGSVLYNSDRTQASPKVDAFNVIRFPVPFNTSAMDRKAVNQ